MRISKSVMPHPGAEPQYVYVFVRTDIPLPNQLAQMGHACIGAGREFGISDEYIVVLQVPNERALLHAVDRADAAGIKSFLFHEPDPPVVGYNAACTEPVKGRKRGCFRRFRLWGS